MPRTSPSLFVAGLLALAAAIGFGCTGRSKAPDPYAREWKVLYATCLRDTEPCKKRCQTDDQMACAILRDKQIARNEVDRAATGSAVDSAMPPPPVPTVLAKRLPASWAPSPPIPFAAVMKDLGDMEATLTTLPRNAPERPVVLGRLGAGYAQLALLAFPSESEPEKRSRLTLGAWSTAVKRYGQLWEQYPKDRRRDETLYSLALASEQSGDTTVALERYRALITEFSHSSFTPLALFGAGVVIEARSFDPENKQRAREVYARCVDFGRENNPVWKEARERAGFPDGYESPAMAERRISAAAEATERRLQQEWLPVKAAIDDIARTRDQVRTARKLGPGPNGMRTRAANAVEADIGRKVSEDYCPAKQAFVDMAGLAEFRQRATDYCEQTAPTVSGLGGVDDDQPRLTADCKQVIANPCGSTASKGSPSEGQAASARKAPETTPEEFPRQVRIDCADGSDASPERFACSCRDGTRISMPGDCQVVPFSEGKTCIFQCQ